MARMVNRRVSKAATVSKRISKAEARFNRMYESQDRGVNSRSSGPSTVAPKPVSRPQTNADVRANILAGQAKRAAVKNPFKGLTKPTDTPEVLAQAEKLRTGAGLKGMDAWGLKPERALERARSEARFAKGADALKAAIRSPEGRAKLAADRRAQLERQGVIKPEKKPYAVAPGGTPETKEQFRARVSADMDASRKAAEALMGGKFGVSPKDSSVPDIAHLAKENKIPAKVADVPAGGKGAFTADLADATPAEYEKHRAEQYDIATKQARDAFKRERKESGEAPGGETGEARRELARDIKAERKAKRSGGGGSFDAAHPRHPAGSSQGGEFRPKK